MFTCSGYAANCVARYLGDGRFHLESVMIANQKLHNRFYRYDPYSCQLSHERYAYADMYSMRREAIELARLPSVRHIAICQGTLGRQGSPAVVEYLQKLAAARGLHVAVVLMSELSPEKMALFGDAVDVWIQTSCPRLRFVDRVQRIYVVKYMTKSLHIIAYVAIFITDNTLVLTGATHTRNRC